MPIGKSSAQWTGNIKEGKGVMKPEHASEIPFSLGTRFEGGGSNPEEMIGAALAGCFSMALTLGLEKSGITPESVKTEAKVHLEKQGESFHIPRIDLSTEIKTKGGDAEKIRAIAQETKTHCPVSRLLAAAKIELETKIA